MRSNTPRGTTYPVFGRIFEEYERNLIGQLSTLYPNEPDQNIAERILVAQWHSCLVTVLDSFIERTTGSVASDLPIEQTLASLCADVDKVVRENRFLLALDGHGKPLYEYVVLCRKSVGQAIMKELKTKRKGAEAHDPKRKPSVSAAASRPTRRRGRLATRNGRTAAL